MNIANQNLTTKDIKILFVDSQEDHKATFLNLLKETEYKVQWEQNSFKAIQWLKNNDSESVTLIVIDKYIKPLTSFQTYDFIRKELKLNIPILIVHDVEDQPDYSDHNDLDFMIRNDSSESLRKINVIIKEQLKYNDDNAATYSLNYLKELSSDNEEFINSSLELFISSVSERLTDMQKALSESNYKKVSKIAHNIKPSFAMIENEAGSVLCDSLAHSVTENDIPFMVKRLNNLFVELKKQMSADFQSHKSL